MKGDFSRISFDAKNHFSRVLLQQGRVTLDADPNEEGAILLHYLRTLARDLIGPCGGPADALGFGLTLDTSGTTPALKIGAGRYYVDGILVENDADCDYAHQPDLEPAADDPLQQWIEKPASGGDVWIYLDVWERHVSWIENDAIRESALVGPDTCTRAKVVWQVRGLPRTALLERLHAKRDRVDAELADTTITPAQAAALRDQRAIIDARIDALAPNADGNADADCTAPLAALDGISDALMDVRLDPGALVKDPCALPPDALYRGVENQLYRVEVHRGSDAVGDPPTFKWSRDNGSVATRWLGTEGNDLMVDSSRGFTAGCWVELSFEAIERLGMPGLLVKLVKVEAGRLGVDPDTIPSGGIALTQGMKLPKVRRWDQTETDDITLDEGAVPLLEATGADDHWIDLEDGIQVRFGKGGSYRSGDYWLIPARVPSGSIEWPAAPAGATTSWQPPQGVEHHYAPLTWALKSGELSDGGCMCTIEPVGDCSRARNRDAKRLGTVPRPPRARPKRSPAGPKSGAARPPRPTS